MENNTKQKVKELTTLLYGKYGTVLISTGDTGHEIQKSDVSLIRDRANGTGLKYVKTSKTTQGRVYYNIQDIAEYIIENTSL